MDHDLVIASLLTGLLLGMVILRKIYLQINTRAFNTVGFNFIGGLIAFVPAILITLKFIDKTLSAVLIAIVYFLAFIIGSVFINSKASKMQTDDSSV